MKLTESRIIFLVIVHLVFGVLANQSAIFVDMWIYLLIIFGIGRIAITSNRQGAAHELVAYIVGGEVLLRMAKAHVFWEMGKYSIVGLLVMGMLVETIRKPKANFASLYFILLVPSIFFLNYPNFEMARQEISFNLSGPLSLLITTLYFYKRQFNTEDIRRLLIISILPLFSAGMMIILRAPSLADITFNDAANSDLSGGYGPNQVASIYAYGLLVIVICFFAKIKFTGTRWLDSFIAFVFFILCVINFSRGPIITTILSSLIGLVVWLTYNDSPKKHLVVFWVVVGAIAISVSFIFVDNYTGGNLSQRYLGSVKIKDPKKEKFGSGVSGRDQIVKVDYEIFKDNWMMGVGPGASTYMRKDYGYRTLGSHTELSRLISEHGLFGVAAIIILISNPFIFFQRSTRISEKLFSSMLSSFSLVMSTHVAMRLGLIGFTYGLAFINMNQEFMAFAPPRRVVEPEEELMEPLPAGELGMKE